jgi:hypothetical protein
MDRQKLIFIILSLLILLVAFALFMHNLNGEAVWHDEGWSIRAMHHPFTEPDDNTPLVYYLTGYSLNKLGFGETPLSFRYISVLIGMVTVSLALQIGRRWYGVMAGLATGLLVGTSPLLWEYSQEVRAYVAVPVIALMLLIGADAVLKRKPGQIVPRHVWAFVFCAELMGLYTHNLTVPMIVWLNFALGMVWLLRRDWSRMVTWAGLQITLIICYIPWLLTQSPSGTPLNTPPKLGLGLARDIWASYFLPVILQLQDAKSDAVNGVDLLTPLLLFGVMVIFFVFISALSKKDVKYRLWLLASHAILVPVFSTVLMLVANIDFHPRYYVAAVPGTMLLIVAAMVISFRRLPQNMVKSKQWAAGYALILAPTLLFSALGIHQVNTTRGYQHDDFAGLAEYYASLPKDTVILVPFASEPALQHYYASRLDIKARFVNLPLHSDEEALIDTINTLIADGTSQIEFLTWFQLPADVRGMYPCILTATSDLVGESQNFYGMQTQSFRLSSELVSLLKIDAMPNYNDFNLLQAGYISSENGVCVRTVWTLNQPLDTDAEIAVSVLNPLGNVISRSEASITRVDNAGTSHWADGDSGQAYNLLKLPNGAPFGEYEISITVYSPEKTSGYDVLDVSGNPAGKSYVFTDEITVAGPLLDDLPPSSVLIIDNSQENTIETGRPLDVELLLLKSTDDNQLPVILRCDDWVSEQVVDFVDSENVVLSWHRFIIPPGNDCDAVLYAAEMELASYTVIDVPRMFDVPDFDVAVGEYFPGVGTLVGASIEDLNVLPDNPPQVTLIWQADEQATDTSYTVFVQLISDDGRVIAQSDSFPVGGTRPTTSWLEGEYLLDTHTLTFNINDYSGPATLIAGFYDTSDGFRRVLTADRVDNAMIPLDIMVLVKEQ